MEWAISILETWTGQITLTIFGEAYTLWSSSIRSLLKPPATSSPLGSKFSPQHLVLKTPRWYCHSIHEGASKSFRTKSITKYTLTFAITRSETTQSVMATKIAGLTHKIAIHMHLVAETCTLCSSRSRRPVRKLLNTPSYLLQTLQKLTPKIREWFGNLRTYERDKERERERVCVCVCARACAVICRDVSPECTRPMAYLCSDTVFYKFWTRKFPWIHVTDAESCVVSLNTDEPLDCHTAGAPVNLLMHVTTYTHTHTQLVTFAFR
jgi:hypothetical protein